MSLKDWQILKNGKRSDFIKISALTLIFLLMTAINVWTISEMTASQAEDSGQSQPEIIRAEFQGKLPHTEKQLEKKTTDFMSNIQPEKISNLFLQEKLSFMESDFVA